MSFHGYLLNESAKMTKFADAIAVHLIGNVCLVDYSSVVTMLIGILFYIVEKPVYLPLQ